MDTDNTCGFSKNIDKTFPVGGILINVGTIVFYVMGLQKQIPDIDNFISFEESKTKEILFLIGISSCAVGILVYISLLIAFYKESVKLLLPSLIILPILFLLSSSLVIVRIVKFGFNDDYFYIGHGIVRSFFMEFLYWLLVIKCRKIMKSRDEELASDHEENKMSRFHHQS